MLSSSLPLEWVLSITRNGSEYGLEEGQITGECRYYFDTSESRCVTIGSAANSDILISTISPSHAVLRIFENTFAVEAHDEMSCELQGERDTMRMNDRREISLYRVATGEKIVCALQIGDNLIHVALQLDQSILPAGSPGHEYLLAKYGPVTKVREEKMALVYRVAGDNPLVVKVMKPLYKIPERFENFSKAGWFDELPRWHPVLLESICRPELDLYGYVQEDLNGESLRDYVVRYKKLDIKLVFQLVCHLLRTLATFQEHGKIHGCLAPENFLLEENGGCRPALTFAEMTLARHHRQINPGFTAPELVIPEGSPGNRTELFSLGALLYFTIVGFPPFATRNVPEYRQAVADGLFSPRFPKNNRLALQLQPLILRCLGQHPDQRPGNIREWWQEFRKITGHPEIEISAATEKSGKQWNISEIHEFPEEKPAERIGHFKIEREIANNSYSVIYAAVDERSGRDIALKLFKNECSTGDPQMERFLDGARIASILEHPHIVKIYACERSESGCYIAMQYVDGLNLQEYMGRQHLSPRLALEFIRDAARALQHAHSRGVIHRNLKPTNILIDKQEHVYVTDFGMEKGVGPRCSQRGGKIVGTLRYMAPEILEGYHPSPLQDVYSLGAILYELLTGQSLIDGLSSVEVISKITHAQPTPRKVQPQLADDVEAICLKALRQNPLRRYQSAGNLAEDIDRFLQCRPILASPSSVWSNLYKQVLRNQGLTITATLSCLVLTLALLYVFFIYSNARKQHEVWSVKGQTVDLLQEISRKHNRELFSLPENPDPLGLSPSSLQTEGKILEQIRNQARERYSRFLTAEILPLYRQSLHIRRQKTCRRDLLEVLRQITRLCHDEEMRRALHMEISELDGRNGDTSPALVRIQIEPAGANLYLYRFEETLDGRKRLLPFDIEKQSCILPKETEEKDLSAREQFLRCQNLLWETALEMLDRDFVSARYGLIRCIEINPDYLEAYFLLCCLSIDHSTVDFSSDFTAWRQRALQRIDESRLSATEKETLCSRFSPSFIDMARALYALLPHRNHFHRVDYLVRVASAPSTPNPLQKGDYIIRIGERPILRAKDLKQPGGEGDVSCTVVRDWQIRKLTLDADLFMTPDFQVQETPPVFYVWKNRALNFTDVSSIYRFPQMSANNVVESEIRLPLGDYLLFCKADEHLCVRYPFRVFPDQNSGRPYSRPISLRLPPLPAELETFLADLVVVPAPFVHGDLRHRNTLGCLLGRYEVTLGEWLAYLKAIADDSKAVADLQTRFPRLEQDGYLVQLRNGQPEIRLGESQWAVCGVTYRQIEDYLTWRNEQLPEKMRRAGLRFRLPTQEEWKAAVSGADGRLYPWGNYPNPKFCKVLSARRYRLLQENTARDNPAFWCDESPFGVNDMGGGVSEFVAQDVNSRRTVKGAGWSDYHPVDVDYLRPAGDGFYNVSLGFRICVGLDPLYHFDY